MSWQKKFTCLLLTFVFLFTSTLVGSSQVSENQVISLVGLDLTKNTQIGFFFSQPNVNKNYAKRYPLKYFFTTLLIPNNELWVNLSIDLSGSEIIGQGINNTDLGRLLLYYDVKLKEDIQKLLPIYSPEITSSLNRDTRLRFWIEPGIVRMEVDEKKVRIKSAPLEVKVEVKGEENRDLERWLKERIIPVLKDRVNKGKDYQILRQAFNSMVLAQWYKKHAREGTAFFRYIDTKAKGKGIVSDTVWFKTAYLQKYVRMYFEGYQDEGWNNTWLIGGITAEVGVFDEGGGNISSKAEIQALDKEEILKETLNQIEGELKNLKNSSDTDKKIDKEAVREVVKNFLESRKNKKEEIEKISLKEGENLVVMNMTSHVTFLKSDVEKVFRKEGNAKIVLWINDSLLSEAVKWETRQLEALYFALSLYLKMPNRIILLRKENKEIEIEGDRELVSVVKSLPIVGVLAGEKENIILANGGIGRINSEGNNSTSLNDISFDIVQGVKYGGYAIISSNGKSVRIKYYKDFSSERDSDDRLNQENSKVISTSQGNVEFIGGVLDDLIAVLNGDKDPIYVKIKKAENGNILVSLSYDPEKENRSSDLSLVRITQRGIEPGFVYGEKEEITNVFPPTDKSLRKTLAVIREAIKKEMEERYYGKNEIVAKNWKGMKGIKEVRLRGIEEKELKEELERVFGLAPTPQSYRIMSPNNILGKQEEKSEEEDEEFKKLLQIWAEEQEERLNEFFNIQNRTAVYVFVCPDQGGYVLRIQSHSPILYNEEEKDWGLLKIDYDTRRIELIRTGRLNKDEIWNIVSQIKKTFMPVVNQKSLTLRWEFNEWCIVGKEFFPEEGTEVTIEKELTKEQKEGIWKIRRDNEEIVIESLLNPNEVKRLRLGTFNRIFLSEDGSFVDSARDAYLMVELDKDGSISVLRLKLETKKRWYLSINQSSIHIRDIVYNDKFYSKKLYRYFEEFMTHWNNHEFSAALMTGIDGRLYYQYEYIIVDWKRDETLNKAYTKVVEKIIVYLREELKGNKDLDKKLSALADALRRVDRAEVEKIMSELMNGKVKGKVINYVYQAIKDTVRYEQIDLPDGTLFFIGDTLNLKKGVCRHTAILTGAILDRLSQAGFLWGKTYIILTPKHLFVLYVTSSGLPIVLDVAQKEFAVVTTKSSTISGYAFFDPDDPRFQIEHITHEEILRRLGFRIPDILEKKVDNGISSFFEEENQNKPEFVSLSPNLEEKEEKENEANYILELRDLSSGEIIKAGADEVNKDDVKKLLTALAEENSSLANLILENWNEISQNLEFYIVHDKNLKTKHMLKHFLGWGGQGKVVVSSSLLDRLDDDATKGLLYLHGILEALVDARSATIGIEQDKVYVHIKNKKIHFPVPQHRLKKILFEKLLTGKNSFIPYLIYELEKRDVETKTNKVIKAFQSEKRDREIEDDYILWVIRGAIITQNMPETLKNVLFNRFCSGQWQEGAILDVLRYLYKTGQIPHNSENIGNWEEIKPALAEKIASNMGEEKGEQFLRDWEELDKETDPIHKTFKRLSLLHRYKVYAFSRDVYEMALIEAGEAFRKIADLSDKKETEKMKEIEKAIDSLSWYNKDFHNKTGTRIETQKGGIVFSLQSLIMV